MPKLLFLNACIDRERSRTLRIARAAVSILEDRGYETEEIILEDEYVLPMTTEILGKRNTLLKEGRYDNPMFSNARTFRDADRIIIAAPFWDFGFPSVLKTYLESVSCPGITYRYTPEGELVGLCRAERITYITTRGGFVLDEKDLGFATIEELGNYFGIPEVDCISANAMDIPTTDVDATINRVIKELPGIL
ncbi:MAG: NAD(P)H-dependent oxidoreductase [Candidatus Methanomethylophilaceae archaeon]|nr:NAD(P)H-dependent oxidoreductase [Candidatus Methanomethylophilaceae archaeon]